MKFFKAIGPFNSSWLKAMKKDKLEISVNEVYLFPYFIDDNNNCILKSMITDKNSGYIQKFKNDLCEWEKIGFLEISKYQFLKISKFNEKNLDFIIELIETEDESNQLIALELYKKEKCKRYNMLE